jgi:F-type H+-transporting ATPase subunit gamma
MSNTQSLTRRIRSAKNIKQITKAMEMVSASKMRKAQSQALSSRPYARKLETTLNAIANLAPSSSEQALLTPNESGRPLLVIVSTDKALAGSLNTNLFRGVSEYCHEQGLENPLTVIVGQKARAFVLSSDYLLHAEFTQLPDPISYADSLPISKLIIDSYIDKTAKSVHIVYMDFISTLVQKVRGFQLLPLSTDWTSVVEDPKSALDAVTPEKSTYVFEPDANTILEWLVPYYIELAIYQVLLESKASEHSARMVSMKNASENATEIIQDLTLSYNKARQAGITAELLDNVTASMIVK